MKPLTWNEGLKASKTLVELGSPVLLREAMDGESSLSVIQA